MSDREDDVLYEVTELHQWKLDREAVRSQESDWGSRFFQKFDVRKILPEKNKDILDYYNSQLPWQLAVSNQDRTLVAVLQENCLEIRHKRDDYRKPIGIATIPDDENPQWRKLTWSADGIYVTFSSSFGEIRCYNTLASLVCSIPRVESTFDKCWMRPDGAVSALLLVEVRSKSPEWPYEIIAIDYFGNLRSYLVSSTQGFKPYHTFSFGESLVTSATYVSTFNILVIAFPTFSLSQKSSEDTLGLSSWRLLVDHPYYRLVKPDIENLHLLNKERSWISLFGSKSRRTLVLKMSLSLNVKYLACMHLCGAISIWTLPQLFLHKIWLAQDMPIYSISHSKANTSQSEIQNALSDVNWCLDTKLVVLCNNGTLTVSNLDYLDNLLARINTKCHIIDRQPEYFFPSARLANVCDMNVGFLVLDHESKEVSSSRWESDTSENPLNVTQDDAANTLGTMETYDYSMLRQILRFFVHFEIFQQRKKLFYVQKIFRLTALKKVTPIEFYEQKINNEEYSEALDFAKLFNLDENRVYKKQWINCHPVTIQAIDDYLLKISDRRWIINQCCERIPETYEAAEMLLTKGLEFTDFSEFILDDELSELEENDVHELKDERRFEINPDKTVTHFSKNQLTILELRHYLLLYWDALFIYKKTLELDNGVYDEKVYCKFRYEPPLRLAFNFAREGNVSAIHVLFTYYGEELIPFWLQILDNIPECISPITYKKLLPAFNDDGKLKQLPCKRIRPAEWSESGDFVDLIVFKKHSELVADKPSYPFSKNDVTKWYEDKIRKIVNESGLIDYALELLNLATKNNISNLEELRHNLLVLDKLIYDLMLEEEKSLSEIESFSDFQKLDLLMSEASSEEEFKMAIHEILFPFLNRCDTLRPNSKDLILDAYMRQLSENDLILPAVFFEYLNERDNEHVMFSATKKLELRLLCIYSCQRLDQVDIALKIIEIESEFSDNNNSGLEEILGLRSRLTEVHTELVIMQLLQKYEAEKTTVFLHNNKRNEQFQKETFTAMVNAKIESGITSQQEIYTLFDDMTYVQENFFATLPHKNYLHIFAYSMLIAGKTHFIEQFAPLVLSCSSSRRPERRDILSFAESVSILVEAAQYYFNISNSYLDPNISLAKACLSLIKFHPDLERERKLIDALKELDSFGVEIPPLKVRMCVDKKKILEKILKANPKAYKKIDQLVSLAMNLETEDVSKEDVKFEVMVLSFEAASEAKDMTWCASVCKLMENKAPSWELCKKLCLCKDFVDLDTKQNMIKTAILHCPDDELMLLVEIRNNIECQVLEKKLQKTLQPLVSGDSNSECISNDNSCNEVKRKNELPSIQELINVPAFMNMLHTSSSNVLNVNFWKNTFRLGFEESAGSQAEYIVNNDCRKFGFPEYYSDIHEHKECICFSSGKLKKEIEIFHQLLRYYLLKTKNDDNITVTNVNDVIVQLAITSFPNDCILTLSFLFLLQELDYSEKVFGSLPSTNIVEKFALYYYSVKLLLEANVNVVNLIQNKPPYAVISNAFAQAEKGNSVYVEVLGKYKKALEKRRSVNKVQDLGCGIDPVRFINDETYKLDSVLGLAMYEERDKLELALSLGKEYGVSCEDVVLSHIKSLFFTSELSLLTNRLKESVVIDTLKQKPSYVTEKLTTEIYEGISGCDYQKLLLYFALTNQIAGDELLFKITPKEHMKLIRKLKSFTKIIDYKLLTCEQSRIVEAVMPAVLSGDINQVLNLLNSLPDPIISGVKLENIHEQLAQKIFFNGRADVNYVKRFESCLKLLEKLSDEKVGELINKFLFSKHSCEILSKEDKENIVDQAIAFYSKKFGENCEFIRNLKTSLYNFSKMEEFVEISSAIDLDEEYMKELKQAIISSQNDVLQSVVRKMIVDVTVSVDTIKVIMEFTRSGSLTDLITELLETTGKEKDIQALLYRVENCLEDNDYEKSWLTQLMKLKESENVSTPMEELIDKICLILEQSDDEIYQIIDMLHETRLILRGWVAVLPRITIFNFVNEETRMALVKNLIEKCGAISHFYYVFKVLELWPRFPQSAEWQSDPFLLLLEKILHLDENEVPKIDVLKLFEKVMNRAKLSKSNGRAFFEFMSSTPHNKILFIWFCVLSNDGLLIQSVSGYIEEIREMRRMPEIVEQKLKNLSV